MTNAESISTSTVHPGTLLIGGWLFYEDAHRLERGGETVKLEPKATLLLAYLAQRAGEPVSREELFQSVWPGVIVGDDALTNAVNKLRRAFGDDPHHPRVIETIPKMGYRLIAPVEHPAVGDAARAEVPTRRTSGLAGPRTVGVGLLLLGLLLGMGLYLLHRVPDGDRRPVAEWLADKPSLAVLPFANQGEDPEQQFFVDGMTEDLITDLSKVSGLYVIARNSVFAYRGLSPRPQDVAQRLGARYVLEGSVRQQADRIRVNVELIDASTGLNLWAERFDGGLDDVFGLQDRVAHRVVAALAVHLTEKEQRALARDPTTSVVALKRYFLGRAYYGSVSKQENDLARKMFHRAIALDPGYARAYAALALTHIDDWRRGWSADPQASVAEALRLAQEAIAVDEDVPQAHFALGYLYLYAMAQHGRAMAAAKTALGLDPNYADTYALLASAYFFAGEPQKALPLDRKAMRLNPGSSFLYYWHLGRVHYFQGRLKQALGAFQKAQERNYSYLPNHVWLAATYGRLGEREEAEWEVEQVLTLDPGFSVEQWIQTRPYKNPAHREQLLKGLREAGFPR